MDPGTKHGGSVAAIRSNLDIFGVPPTDTSVVSSNFVPISPVASITDEYTPIVFVIPASSAQYIDLGSSYLYLQAQVVKKDGTNLASTDVVAPTNMFFYAAFKNCQVSINGVVVGNSQNEYAYQAGIQALLMNGFGKKESEMTSILFYKDTAPDTFDITTNAGFKKRVELAAGSKVFDMVGPIASGIFRQTRYLPTDCNVNIQLIRQTNYAFCLDAASATAGVTTAAGATAAKSATDVKEYKFKILNATMQIKMHTVNPTLMNIHNQLFAKSRALFPIRDTLARTCAILTGSKTFTSQPLFERKMPQVIVAGLVSAEADQGNLSKNCFNFQHFNLSSIGITCDNELMLYRSLDVNFKSNLYQMGYQTIFGGANGDGGNYVSRDDYKTGNCLYLFDISSSAAGAPFRSSNPGQIRVELKFAESLDENVNLVVLGSFQYNIELDQFRNVYM